VVVRVAGSLAFSEGKLSLVPVVARTEAS